MNNVRRQRELEPKGIPPDLFRAAEKNDIKEMNLALAAGQSLSMQDPQRLNMTPVHIATLEQSNDFLAAAVEHETCDLWIRDMNLRTAYDHAMAFNNTEAMDIMFEPMHSYLHEKDGEVVTFPTDDAPGVG